MGGRIDEGMPRMANERLPEQSVPDRGPGHAFVPIAHAGWCRHSKVGKSGVVAWYGELARWVVPRPTPAPAGDKPPHYIDCRGECGRMKLAADCARPPPRPQRGTSPRTTFPSPRPTGFRRKPE